MQILKQKNQHFKNSSLIFTRIDYQPQGQFNMQTETSPGIDWTRGITQRWMNTIFFHSALLDLGKAKAACYK